MLHYFALTAANSKLYVYQSVLLVKPNTTTFHSVDIQINRICINKSNVLLHVKVQTCNLSSWRTEVEELLEV